MLGPGPLGSDGRSVEAPVPDLPGQVADGGMAQLSGRHELVDDPLVVLAGLFRQRLGVAQPPAQQVGHDRHVISRAAVRQEDPVQGRPELGRGLQPGDAVVGEGPAQLDPERLGQAFCVGVKGAQVGVQVLLLVVSGLGVHRGLVVSFGLAGHPAVAPQRGNVGEDPQDAGLAGQQPGVTGRKLRSRGGQPLQLPSGLVPVDIEAEHHGAQGRQRVGSGGRRVVFVAARAGQRAQVDPGLRLPAAVRLEFLILLDPDQLGAGLDLGVDVNEHLGDPAGHRGAQRRLQLHALHDGHDVARRDLVAGADRYGHHHGRGRGADQSRLAAGEPVHRSVDLDQVVRALRDREHVEVLAADAEVELEPARPLDVDLHRAAVQLHPVPGRPGPGHPELVGLGADADVGLMPRLVPYLRAPVLGGGKQPVLLAPGVRLVGLEGGGQQRDVDPPRWRVAVGHHRVQPGRVDLAADELRPVQQVEQEALVRGPALDHRGGLPERAGQPGAGLGPVPAPGDHLGDHRVELRRDNIARRDPGVDPDAGARGQRQVLDQARRGREVTFRVLGGQPGLDGVPVHRRLARDLIEHGPDLGQGAAGRDVQLQLDDVQAGGRLGDRVLDLQPGVDLEERQQPLPRLVEELHGRGVDVAGGPDQLRGVGAHHLLLLGGQHRGGGLLDHLLVAPLHAAVPDAQRPHRALGVGDHLHLDVVAAADGPLEEHRRVAGRLARLRAGPLERLVKLLGRPDQPDAAPAAARGGLDHQRIADRLRGGPCFLQVGHRAAAPRRERHASLLGQPLGLDLVAEPAHDVGRRADEGDPQPLAQLGELGLLRDEPPARPHRIGPALP